MHVLIVDDEDSIRRGLDRLLRMHGHTTCWAATGEGALKLMHTERVDVVILDMMLGPGSMSGWDVAREKLLDPGIRAIPVIILSGLAPATIRENARAASDALAGTTLILTKPCEIDVLLKALELLMKKSDPPPEPPPDAA